MNARRTAGVDGKEDVAHWLTAEVDAKEDVAHWLAAEVDGEKAAKEVEKNH